MKKTADLLRHYLLPRIWQCAAALLFTAVLSASGMAAEHRSPEDPGAMGKEQSGPEADDVNLKAAGDIPESISPERTPSGKMMTASRSSAADTDTLLSVRDTESMERDYRTDSSNPEEIQWDRDTLLSIVSTLPREKEHILSSKDILTSAEIKKVKGIINRIYEEGNHVSFIVLDLHSGNYCCLDPDFSYYSASTIKGPYVAALCKFGAEPLDEWTRDMMENTIMWSSNEDYEELHYLYGNDAMYDMTEYTDVPDSIIDEYNWYPYLTPKELTKLWIGIYLYFFEDTNENSRWCRSLYTDSVESFIGSALGEEYTVYTKPGWYSDWEDISRNDAGIIMADGHDYILTVMSDAFLSYDDLEELAGALNEVHELLAGS